MQPRPARAAAVGGYLNEGDPRGRDWVSSECDVSIRPGWFWHKNETTTEAA